MKLGVAYNFFDCEELLEYSINSIRNNVDYICIIYQDVSNYGEKYNEDVEELFDKLLLNNIVDDIILYEPNLSKTPHENEIRKRNVGLHLCRENDCSHILMMDADELYIDSEFKKAKDIIESENYDYSACQMLTYFKEPIYQIIPMEKYFVPFIHRIYEDSLYVFNSKYPVVVDPTRRLSGPYNNFHKFSKELLMRHYSFVRKDIRTKIMNSSARCNIKNPEAYISMFNNWKQGDRNFHPANPSEFRNTKIVENIFNIVI